MKNIYRFICLFLFVLLMVLPANAAVATENTTDFQGGKGTGTQYIGGSYYTFDQNGVWIP